jgi:hypothetical protein
MDCCRDARGGAQIITSEGGVRRGPDWPRRLTARWGVKHRLLAIGCVLHERSR